MVKRSQSRANLAGLTAEEKRLEEDKKKQKFWRRWGPYMSERQWVSIFDNYLGIYRDLWVLTIILGGCERRLFI